MAARSFDKSCKERLALRLGEEIITAGRSSNTRVIISAYLIENGRKSFVYLVLHGSHGFLIFDNPADYERFWNGTDVRVGRRRSAGSARNARPGGWRVRLGPQSVSLPLLRWSWSVACSCGVLTSRVPGSAAGRAGWGVSPGQGEGDVYYRTHIWSSRGP
jgi:hypothetical protein